MKYSHFRHCKPHASVFAFLKAKEKLMFLYVRKRIISGIAVLRKPDLIIKVLKWVNKIVSK